MTAQEIESVCYLTPLQEGILFHHLQAPEQADYVVQISGEVKGLDLDRWSRAWSAVLARHAMLRTGIAWKSQVRPLQLTLKSARLMWDTLDWSDRDSASQKRDFQTLQKAVRADSFDLSMPPLMRGTVIHLGYGAWRFLWSHHHIILDAWSSSRVLNEVLAFYNERAGESSLLKATPFKHYADHLARQEAAADDQFWRRYLHGISSHSFWRPDGKPEVVTEVLSVETTAHLERFCRQHGVTPATLTLAAIGTLLCVWTRRADQVIGITLAHRPAEIAIVEEIVGPCIATVPVRMVSDQGDEALEILSGVQTGLADCLDHAGLSLSRIAQNAGLSDASGLFDTLLVFENLPKELGVDSQTETDQVGSIETEWYTHYPVTIMAAPGDRFKIQVRGAVGQQKLGNIAKAVADLTGNRHTNCENGIVLDESVW